MQHEAYPWDVDLALWRGAYRINGLQIVKVDGKVPVPFVKAPVIDLSVSWHSLCFADNAHSIGNTPLVQINRIAPRGVTILAKIEGRNPGYSVKCRIGANMIWDAEGSGKLKPGMTIVEPTSGTPPPTGSACPGCS